MSSTTTTTTTTTTTKETERKFKDWPPKELAQEVNSQLVNAKPGLANISTAARIAKCSSVEVVRAILDGHLARKGRLVGERGYMAVLVDVERVRAMVRGPDHGGLTMRRLAERLGTNDRVVTKLIGHGHPRPSRSSTR